MATQIIKWQGANGTLHDTEAEADQSLADATILHELTEWIYRAVDDISDRHRAEELAIAVIRGFDVTRRRT